MIEFGGHKMVILDSLEYPSVEECLISCGYELQLWYYPEDWPI